MWKIHLEMSSWSHDGELWISSFTIWQWTSSLTQEGLNMSLNFVYYVVGFVIIFLTIMLVIFKIDEKFNNLSWIPSHILIKAPWVF
jgi:hypothetical protein